MTGRRLSYDEADAFWVPALFPWKPEDLERVSWSHYMSLVEGMTRG